MGQEDGHGVGIGHEPGLFSGQEMVVDPGHDQGHGRIVVESFAEVDGPELVLGRLLPYLAASFPAAGQKNEVLPGEVLGTGGVDDPGLVPEIGQLGVILLDVRIIEFQVDHLPVRTG